VKDLAIALDNRPGALAEMGEALGKAGVSVEGGGAWVVDGRGVAHFLFKDGTAARQALEAKGITVLAELAFSVWGGRFTALDAIAEPVKLLAKPDKAVIDDQRPRPIAISRPRYQLSASRPSGIPKPILGRSMIS